MRRSATTRAVLGLLLNSGIVRALTVPASPIEMMRRAADAVARASEAGVSRQIVQIIVPEDERTYKVFGMVEIEGTSAPQDLDPWPGGLKQQYPIALSLCKKMLQRVTGADDNSINDQVLDAEDACGLVLAQGATPAKDVACALFVGTDQMDELSRLDAMADGRLLCLVNPQFKRMEDFSLWQRGKARSAYFERGYEVAYAFEEFACRGEDVKLVGEFGEGWQAFVVLDDTTNEALPLHNSCLPERPDYKWLEAQINEQHPQPRWARMLNDVDEKGLRFMRGEGATDSAGPP